MAYTITSAKKAKKRTESTSADKTNTRWKWSMVFTKSNANKAKIASNDKTTTRRQKRLSLRFVRKSHLEVGPTMMGITKVTQRSGAASLPKVSMSHS